MLQEFSDLNYSNQIDINHEREVARIGSTKIIALVTNVSEITKETLMEGKKKEKVFRRMVTLEDGSVATVIFKHKWELSELSVGDFLEIKTELNLENGEEDRFLKVNTTEFPLLKTTIIKK